MKRIFIAVNETGHRISPVFAYWQQAKHYKSARFRSHDGEKWNYVTNWGVKELVKGKWINRKHANDKAVEDVQK